MDAEGKIGLSAVRAAAKLCEAVRAGMVSGGGAGAISKQDGSPVTIADFGSQALICRAIRDAFPGDVIVAEEDSAALRDTKDNDQLSAVRRFVCEQVGPTDQESICGWIDLGAGEPCERFWVLDPIDGTKGFLRQDQYAIALALIEGGRIEWGFLACPPLPYSGRQGAIFVARRGHGTRAFGLDGALLGPVRVSPTTDLASVRLVESMESAHTNRDVSARLNEAIGTLVEPLRMDSQAKYAAVACGQADVYLRSPNPKTPEYREHIWDHAAGSIIVEEAGGQVTDVHGRPLDWTHGRRLNKNVGVVATNGQLHDAVIRLLE